MTKRDLVLAALASSPGATYTPVQVQKLLFLLDKNISAFTDGPVFNFTPYDYGPFDSSVYSCLESHQTNGLAEVEISHGTRGRRYRLTADGQKAWEEILGRFSQDIAKYIGQLSAYVRSLSFAELVSAIYQAYPEMRARSVFRG